jgi:hypothetical protein
MALRLGSAGRTFAPASATTRSVVTPESAWTASNSLRRSEIPDHEPGQQPGARAAAAPTSFSVLRTRLGRAFIGGVIDRFHDGTMNLEAAPELMVANH